MKRLILLLISQPLVGQERCKMLSNVLIDAEPTSEARVAWSQARDALSKGEENSLFSQHGCKDIAYSAVPEMIFRSMVADRLTCHTGTFRERFEKTFEDPDARMSIYKEFVDASDTLVSVVGNFKTAFENVFGRGKLDKVLLHEMQQPEPNSKRIRRLLAFGAQPNGLHVDMAVNKYQPEIFRALLRANTSYNKDTCLKLAFHNGSLDMVRTLMRDGALIGEDGFMYLKHAVEHGYESLVAYLLQEAGVKVSQEEANNLLHEAIDCNHDKVAELLIHYAGARITREVTREEIHRMSGAMLKIFVDGGLCVDRDYGRDLESYLMHNEVEKADQLMRAGADPTFLREDRVDIAIYRYNPHMACMLLEHGLKMTRYRPFTLLAQAIDLKDAALVKRVIALRLPIDRPHELFMRAVQTGSAEIVESIMQLQKTCGGEQLAKAIEQAERNNDSQVADRLKKSYLASLQTRRNIAAILGGTLLISLLLTQKKKKKRFTS